MKKVAIILLIALACIMLCSCAEEITTNIGGTACEIQKYSLEKEIAGITPENSGNMLLRVDIQTSNSSDPDKLSDVFFGDVKSNAQTGSNLYECKAIAFSEDEDGLIAIPIYEVPAINEKTEYTITGQGFDPFTFTVDPKK